MAKEQSIQSYSSIIRSEIFASQIKKECCKRALLDGVIFIKGDLSDEGVAINVLSEETATYVAKLSHSVYGSASVSYDQFGDSYTLIIHSDKARNRLLYLTANDISMYSAGKCSSCRSAFLKGVFLACGRFTDPTKSFQLEFSAASHAKKANWEPFTDAVIRALSSRREKIAFILWGNFAIGKKGLIDTEKHLILESVHPSPLSARRGFFGSRPFSQVQAYNGIKWHLP